MSSTYDGSGGYLPASYCLDDDTGGHTCHTLADSPAWLEIDLGSLCVVKQVEIWNSIPRWERLGKYEIWLGSATGVRTTKCFAGDAGAASSASNPLLDVCVGIARFVTVLLPAETPEGTKILNLHEVYVYGRTAPPSSPLPRVGAKMSSTYDASGGYLPAPYCIDDNVGGPLCHTYLDAPAWLEVDLGSLYYVTKVTIYNRESHWERLGQYEIWLGSTSEARNTKCFNGTATSINPLDVVCHGIGRYVTVLLPGEQRTLNLHEVYIDGFALPSIMTPPSPTPPHPPSPSGAIIELTGDSPIIKFGDPNAPTCELALDRASVSLTSTCEISQAGSQAGRRLQDELNSDLAALKAEVANMKKILQQLMKSD